jgi:hypothetical protein
MITIRRTWLSGQSNIITSLSKMSTDPPFLKHHSPFSTRDGLSAKEIIYISKQLAQLSEHHTGNVRLKIIVQPSPKRFKLTIHRIKQTETSEFLTHHTVLGSDPKEQAGPTLTTYYMTADIPEKTRPCKLVAFLYINIDWDHTAVQVQLLDKTYRRLSPFKLHGSSLRREFRELTEAHVFY